MLSFSMFAIVSIYMCVCVWIIAIVWMESRIWMYLQWNGQHRLGLSLCISSHTLTRSALTRSKSVTALEWSSPLDVRCIFEDGAIALLHLRAVSASANVLIFCTLNGLVFLTSLIILGTTFMFFRNRYHDQSMYIYFFYIIHIFA